MVRRIKEITDEWEAANLAAASENQEIQEKGGAMNKNQKRVIIITVCILVGMFLFPPFEATFSGNVYNKGFSFITEPPHVRAVINITQLLAQEAVAVVVGFGLWFLSKD